MIERQSTPDKPKDRDTNVGSRRFSTALVILLTTVIGVGSCISQEHDFIYQRFPRIQMEWPVKPKDCPPSDLGRDGTPGKVKREQGPRLWREC